MNRVEVKWVNELVMVGNESLDGIESKTIEVVRRFDELSNPVPFKNIGSCFDGDLGYVVLIIKNGSYLLIGAGRKGLPIPTAEEAKSYSPKSENGSATLMILSYINPYLDVVCL